MCVNWGAPTEDKAESQSSGAATTGCAVAEGRCEEESAAEVEGGEVHLMESLWVSVAATSSSGFLKEVIFSSVSVLSPFPSPSCSTTRVVTFSDDTSFHAFSCVPGGGGGGASCGTVCTCTGMRTSPLGTGSCAAASVSDGCGGRADSSSVSSWRSRDLERDLPRVTLSRNSLKDATISRVRDFDLERDLEALSMASGWSWGASRRTFATMVMAATFLSGVSFP